MDNGRDPRVIGAWVVGLTSLFIYFLTVAPTVAFWDAGEFIAASYSLGITHPPGAPTFLLLGRLFTMLPTPFGAAAEVNFISVISSAATALLLYGIILEILYIWESRVGIEGGHSYPPTVQALAAGTGAFAYAFSHSAWFNAVEAEVYSLSMAVTALCLWLALRHLRGAGEQRRASLLLLIGYVMGVGTGNHLLALLTIPSILILLWYFDRDVIRRVDVWTGVLLLFAAGYTIYLMLLIRSGLNPPVDMNNPENWQNFLQVLQRRQYGTESMLLSVFDRRADFWSYQLNYQFLRYYQIEFFLPIYLLAIFGAAFNLQRDRKTFLANAALWTIMGLGLVVYLNMPDPQPRDRDYIFVGCYFATAIWAGIGIAGLAGYLREYLERSGSRGEEGGEPADAAPDDAVESRALKNSTIIVGVLGVLIVCTQLVLNFHRHDRARDFIAWDYSYNILETCPPNTILFTNGDNDTYPLWYLQVVEGLRRDVRVVNLSILNLPWYIKELRDREPKVPMSLTDQQIESMGLTAIPQDTTYKLAGIDWKVPGRVPIRTQDQMVARIIAVNQWERPVYFAITVPVENQAWFNDYMQLEGFAFRVLPDAELVDIEGTLQKVREVFQYRGITDPRVYKDENASDLIHNYRFVVQQTADSMLEAGDVDGAYELLEWADGVVDLSYPDNAFFHALVVQATGDTTRAQAMLEAIIDKEFQIIGHKVRAFVVLIYSYAANGDFPKAALVCNKFIEMFPGDPDVRNWFNVLSQGRMPADFEQLALRFMP